MSIAVSQESRCAEGLVAVADSVAAAAAAAVFLFFFLSFGALR